MNKKIPIFVLKSLCRTISKILVFLLGGESARSNLKRNFIFMEYIYFYPLKGYENYYEITCSGIVRNASTHKILRQENNKGYLRVALCKNNKIQRHLVHRLVANNFITNKEFKRYVNHIDGNKLNNTIDNLEWVTASENELHSYSVLNKINPQRKLILNVDYGIFYDTIEDAAKSIGIKYKTLSAMLTGQNKNKTNLIYAT